VLGAPGANLKIGSLAVAVFDGICKRLADGITKILELFLRKAERARKFEGGPSCDADVRSRIRKTNATVQLRVSLGGVLMFQGLSVFFQDQTIGLAPPFVGNVLVEISHQLVVIGTLIDECVERLLGNAGAFQKGYR
jgi:hypothetical protein